MLIQSTFFKFSMFWPDPTHQPTHPPIHQTIHLPMGEEFFTDFKSSNGIEISWLVQVLLNFYWFQGSIPLGVADGWMGWGWVWVCEGMSHACMHAHAHTCMHVRMHMHVEHDKHAKHGCLHVSGHLQFLYMYTCVCMYVHACMCVCLYVGTPLMPPDTPHPPPTCPLPRAAGNPKHQNSISLELIKIIRFDSVWRFFTSEHSWIHIDYSCSPLIPPPTCLNPFPFPQAVETQIGRITITFEWNEIIEFCLKIWNPWTLLHTYRLCLMCRWRVSYPKWHFYVFDPKKCSCDPPIKKFPICALDSIRPCLYWALRGFLTS